MRKRGVSHVEIILSFVIFVAAVGFALYVFSPADGSTVIESTLAYSFREVSANASVIVESYSVKINNSDDVLPDNTLAIVIPTLSENPEYGVGVETVEGNVLRSKIVGDTVFVTNDDGFSEEDFMVIRISEDFGDGDSSVSEPPHNPNYYEISSSKTLRFLSEKRIRKLQEHYEPDYLILRQRFNLPNRGNWGFSVVFDDGETIVAERPIPSNLEVFSETKRIEILRENGRVVFSDFSVAVW